jgi:NADH:ubiquinone oxidoreductase subunit F (NADH-binding)
MIPPPPTVRPAAPRLLGSSGPDDLQAHLQRYGTLPRISAAALLDEVETSGLLGRGGAGFPTARKMRTVAAGAGPTVVVGNGCEGEPASSKDALLLERSPHLVLDGLQAAAKAVGADTAHLVLHKDSAAVARVGRAIAERRKAGLDPVPVQLHGIPARYVSSEESAIVSFLNGGPAKPTFTPPRPYESGVGKRPTLINNAETLGHLGLIARRGGEWFRQVGDADEPGTQLVTAAGPGAPRRVLEVETGTTVDEVFALAGIDADACQAVLVGGYFGTWLSAETARPLRLTHASLKAAGGALGAGIVIGLPRDRCGLVETSRVATYLAAHNAGQCGPCLNGLPAIASALHHLAYGPWHEDLGVALSRWLTVVPGRGACRHPDGAVRLVGSALSVFAADVARHRQGLPCAGSSAPGFLPVPDLAATKGAWR